MTIPFQQNIVKLFIKQSMNKIHAPIGLINIIYPNGKIKVQKMAETNKVSCTGLDSSSQHPKVMISIKNQEAKCPYCGIIFQKNL